MAPRQVLRNLSLVAMNVSRVELRNKGKSCDVSCESDVIFGKMSKVVRDWVQLLSVVHMRHTVQS